ncbi:MAG TPA: class I SAM-dependent methyltransferase [Gaiellaceae bacterium]|nr:class I SAM-dependent methyltransferase [Gaiellaceae bacterium]
MTDTWSQRAGAYRAATEHAAGEDLDLVVEWCDAAPGVTALDVATGGGHTARALRAAGCTVVTLDPAPGMEPDVIGRAEDLPFADDSFDVAVSRIAPHHFEDVAAAISEMARVARRVVVEDTLYVSKDVEDAERLRDPTHVRAYSEAEWRELFAGAGLVVEDVAFVEKRRPVDDWLARTGCTGDDAKLVRSLLAAQIVDGDYVDTKILLRGSRGR